MCNIIIKESIHQVRVTVFPHLPLFPRHSRPPPHLHARQERESTDTSQPVLTGTGMDHSLDNLKLFSVIPPHTCSSSPVSRKHRKRHKKQRMSDGRHETDSVSEEEITRKKVSTLSPQLAPLLSPLLCRQAKKKHKHHHKKHKRRSDNRASPWEDRRERELRERALESLHRAKKKSSK